MTLCFWSYSNFFFSSNILIGLLGVNEITSINFIKISSFYSDLDTSYTFTPLENYGDSVYWALATMTSAGYGDIHATNTIEKSWFFLLHFLFLRFLSTCH